VSTRIGHALASLRAELDALDASRPALRRFGWVVGGVFVGIAVLIVALNAWTFGPWSTGLTGVGTLLVLAGTAMPDALAPVFRVWMGIAVVLGAIMTRVILTLVFVLLMLPIAFLLRLVGKELMPKRPDPEAVSYWIDRDEATPLLERLERYY
jgi:hypothetical protein